MTITPNKFIKKGKVTEVDGKITVPIHSGLRLILSTCSVSGEFGSPLQKALNKCWPQVRIAYKTWFVNREGFKLGNINTTLASSDIWVVSMACNDKEERLDEKAFDECMSKVRKLCAEERASVHVTEDLLKECPKLKEVLSSFTDDGVNVYFYKKM